MELWEKVNDWKEKRGVSAAVYRELTEVGERDDGLLSADRAVFKIDLEALSAAAGNMPLTPRVKVALPTARLDAGAWLYTDKPVDGWNRLECDVSTWKSGQGPFGSPPEAGGNREGVARTPWKGEDVWVRREFTLGVEKMSAPWLLINRIGEVEVFVNDRLVAKGSADAAVPGYVELLLDPATRDALRPGRNVVAVHCKQPKDRPRRFLDFGLVDVVPQRDCRLPKTLAHWPLLDTFFRDTSICLAADGNYYLTGTTGDWGKEGIRLWKSADLRGRLKSMFLLRLSVSASSPSPLREQAA